MATKNNGGSAFPVAVPAEFQFANDGMTLRDYFAGQAMTGWLASYQPEDGDPAPESLATFSYAIANAMLAEREK